MATTNLFADPVFKDGAFTSNDHKVRAYALQKTMSAIDLGVEFGAQTYVFWGGREGTESDASKDPVTAIKRTREAMDFLCEYVLDQGYDLADFARGSMRTYLILKDRASHWKADQEIQSVLAQINADDGSTAAFSGAYTTTKAADLKEYHFDPSALGRRGMAHERLDQLTVEVLLGVR